MVTKDKGELIFDGENDFYSCAGKKDERLRDWHVESCAMLQLLSYFLIVLNIHCYVQGAYCDCSFNRKKVGHVAFDKTHDEKMK